MKGRLLNTSDGNVEFRKFEANQFFSLYEILIRYLERINVYSECFSDDEMHNQMRDTLDRFKSRFEKKFRF